MLLNCIHKSAEEKNNASTDFVLCNDSSPRNIEFSDDAFTTIILGTTGRIHFVIKQNKFKLFNHKIAYL